ncbi:MAG: nucleotidyltransferase family protein [Chloroflexota bacterium]
MHPIIAERRQEIADICQRYHVLRLELFGSAATDLFNPELSDVDFWVRFLPLEGRAYPDAYFGLLRELENLLSRPVDLLSNPVIRNPYLRESIEQSRLLIYAS